MRVTNIFLLGLGFAGGYLIWRNRFAIQKQLESMGINTPGLSGNITDTVRSVGAKVSGKIEHGVNSIDNQMSRKVGV